MAKTPGWTREKKTPKKAKWKKRKGQGMLAWRGNKSKSIEKSINVALHHTTGKKKVRKIRNFFRLLTYILIFALIFFVWVSM